MPAALTKGSFVKQLPCTQHNKMMQGVGGSRHVISQVATQNTENISHPVPSDHHTECQEHKRQVETLQ